MEEIYFNKELADISFEVDALDEWKQTCKELNMEKQLTLTKGKESPVPYPYMNEIMQRVYETLCPNKVDYRSYETTPIPLKVLKQIAFSKKENHFNEISIWHNEKHPDPIVVGKCGYWYVYNKDYNRVMDENKEIMFNTQKDAEKFQKEKGYYSTGYHLIGLYIMARWGDELRKFDELKGLAVQNIIENIGGELQREIKEKSQKLDSIKENAVSFINGNIQLSEVKGSRGW